MEVIPWHSEIADRFITAISYASAKVLGSVRHDVFIFARFHGRKFELKLETK